MPSHGKRFTGSFQKAAALDQFSFEMCIQSKGGFVGKTRLPDLSWYNIPKWKKYQITIKYTQWPQNISNGCKIDEMAMKYTNIYHCKFLQNLPKLGFLVRKYAIWQPCGKTRKVTKDRKKVYSHF
jgi:hypothetical protein